MIYTNLFLEQLSLVEPGMEWNIWNSGQRSNAGTSKVIQRLVGSDTYELSNEGFLDS